ncbi:MAG: AMP-dependent synthetase/ligase [Salibacteraceae bacterium]
MSIKVTRLFDAPYFQKENFRQETALAAKIDGQWISTSTEDWLRQSNDMSKGLLKLGIGPDDKVALISNNRPEWCIADTAILQIGAVDVPIYPTISEDDYRHIFNDAGIKICIVSDEELLGKVKAIFDDIPTLSAIYTFDKIEGAKHWTEIMELGKDGDQAEVDRLKDAVKETDLATLIYTSGTTGLPKGVMLSHQNIMSNVWGSEKRLPVSPGMRSLSFLPVCHIYERMLIYLYAVSGISIYFAESLDTIGDNLREVKPQVFSAVPRLLEKVYERIMAKGNELTGIKRGLFFWAISLGEQYKPFKANGGWYEFKLSIARKLIFSKWQEALGGQTLAVSSGSAALSPRLNRIFMAAGIPVMEGYGLTETSPVVSVNCQENKGVQIGTCGRPLHNVEVKIADDGEIVVKGPNVMMGYYNRPDLTREVLTEDGWFHTGDIGTLVDGEFLKITDRKKEIFKTSGGKYIAPQIMENKFKESRFIEQIMVIGENQKHPAALVVPNFEFVHAWAKEKGFSLADNADLIQNERVQARVWKEVDRLNAGFGNYEKVKKIELCPADWSVDTGELTPTLKLKRKKILAKYQALHDRIYGASV